MDTCADTGDHSVTTIAHDAAGTPTVIIGPYGQRTAVSVDAHGYLAAITNPNAETTQFQLSDKGLLTGVTDASGNTTSFTYDADGRLQQSMYPTGSGSDTLTRTEVPVPNGSGYQVTHTTGTGVQTTYQVQFLGTGDQVQTTTLPDGTVQTTTVGTDGSRSVSQPDGVQQSVQQSPDPRFGMQAPVSNNMSVMTPDGLTATVTDSRTATLADPTNLLSLSSQTDTVSINGRQITRAWDASTRTLTDTSPVGRHTYTVLDAQGRTVEQQTGTLAPTEFAYDGTSRLIGIAQGSRASTLTYDAAGNVASVTDPAGRTVSFAYDGAGRVVVQTLPDLRQIVFDYDANGNVTAITPPGRPAHAFTYLPKGQLQFYWPPQPSPPLAEPRTRYDYYLDGELARITRPDGQQINFTTDPETGQLLAQALPTGQIYYRYDVVTGNLNEIDAPGETIVYTSDSSLPLSETWSGSVAGSVSRTYDNSFRVATQRVNGGSTVSFGYDADDLLTSAGALTLARDAQTGLLTGTTFGNVNDVYTYNTLGEVTGYQASVGGTPIFTEAYTRDALGRIAAKTETVQGTTETYGYSYDLAGRLTDVTRNGTLIGHYEYDDNGNRIPDANGDSTLTFNQAGMLFSATYDDQDRLLAIQQGPATVDYTYTANGELLSNTDTSTNTSTTYIYDVLGNLTEAVLPSGDVIDYVIDGQNRRVGKAINGTLVRSWLYDGQLKVVAELDGAGTLVSRFAYGTKANVPDYVVQGGMTYRIISDHLGSVRLVVNASTGAIAQRIDYAEFGNVLNDTSPGFQPFAFAGGLYDPATGFVRFGARDYAAELGRWAAKDPIRFDALDSNLYGYIFSDPIDASDSTGESADQMVIGQVGGTLPLISILSKTAFVGSAALFAAVVNNVIGEICRSDGTYRFVYGIPVCRYVCRDGTTFERPGKMTLGMVSCPRAAKRPQ